MASWYFGLAIFCFLLFSVESHPHCGYSGCGGNGVCDCSHPSMSNVRHCVAIDIEEHHYGSSHSMVFINMANSADIQTRPRESPCLLLNDHVCTENQFRSCSSSRWAYGNVQGNGHSVSVVDHDVPRNSSTLTISRDSRTPPIVDPFSGPFDLVGVSEFFGDDLCMTRFQIREKSVSGIEFDVNLPFNDPSYFDWSTCNWPLEVYDSLYKCVHIYPRVENKASTILFPTNINNVIDSGGDPCPLVHIYDYADSVGCVPFERVDSRSQDDWCVGTGSGGGGSIIPDIPAAPPGPIGGDCVGDRCDCDLLDNMVGDCIVVGVEEQQFGATSSSVFVNFAEFPKVDPLSSCYALNDYITPTEQFLRCSSSRWINTDSTDDDFQFYSAATHLGISLYWGDGLCLDHLEARRNFPNLNNFQISVPFYDPIFQWEDCLTTWGLDAYDRTHKCVHIDPHDCTRPSTMLVDISGWNSFLLEVQGNTKSPSDLSKCQSFTFYSQTGAIGCEHTWLIHSRSQLDWCNAISS